MLAVDKAYRRKGLGSRLVKEAVRRMQNEQADEVVLEAEYSNSAAMELYLNLGFVKTKLLARYYLNGSDAYRLKLALTTPRMPEDLYQTFQKEQQRHGNYSDSE